MKRFTSGLIAGSLIGVLGLSYAMSDKKTRRRIVRDGKRVMNKTNGLIDNITDIF